MPSTKMFFCDPPGTTAPENVINFDNGQDQDLHYIWFHDQEPIHLDVHSPLFREVFYRNHCLSEEGPSISGFVTSEWNSEFVEQACKLFEWDKYYYYFFHGWAALDWYRGYNRCYLMPDPEDRVIQKSFISPNRIVGGKRDHRILLLYYIFKLGINNAWISCPSICPAENTSIDSIASKFANQYPDIQTVFQNANLPMNFPNEQGHPMHSCWLSLFNECSNTLCYLVTETVFFGRRNHLTEKTFKPICQQLPFIIASSAGSLEYLRRYGFRTFSNVWDESYDSETNDLTRIERIAKLIKELDSCSSKELTQLYRACLPAIKHNYAHFYGGDFENILWKEMSAMLIGFKHDFRVR